MNRLKQSFDVLLVATCILSAFVLYGCGAQSLGPQEPLLPTIEGSSKFSARFQLEEEPQFFYDLFEKELLEGNEIYNYREQKEFNQSHILNSVQLAEAVANVASPLKCRNGLKADAAEGGKHETRT